MSDAFAPVLHALTRPGRPSSDYDLNTGITLPEGRKLRQAGVLIAFEETPAGLRLYLTKRASHLRNHPGQIAFPGGKVDPGDADAQAAALREAHEEIGLDPANVEILGALPTHETVTNFAMTPILGRVRDVFDYRPEPGEVAEVFEVPLAHLADPARFAIEQRRWRGEIRRYYTVPYGPYYIWGATARMLRALADRMAP